MDNDTLKTLALPALLLVGILLYRSHHPTTTFAADGTDASWDAAAQRSRQFGEPTVVLFTAGWCPTCQLLHANVLSRGDVQEELYSHYFLYTVDLTNPSAAAEQHSQKLGVRYIPTLIRFDKDGNETGRTNFLEGDDLIAWLKAGE
jgi:thiol:disulfide interchange protein